MGTFEPVPTMTAAASRRTAIVVLLVVVLAVAAVAVLVVTGRAPFAYEPVAGRSAAVLEDIPGPETGPVCPLDKRYVDEQPEGLRRDVSAAFTKLRTEAGAQGVQLCVQDGKRSVAQQEREFAAAVRKFGNEELASKYVLPPDKSMHVKGIAVDVQPLASAGWVTEHGRALGWCRRYENEPWHFEYNANYAADGCPALLPSAAGT